MTLVLDRIIVGGGRRRIKRRVLGRRRSNLQRRHGALELSVKYLVLLLVIGMAVVELPLLLLLSELLLPLGMPLEREPRRFGGRLRVVVEPLRLKGAMCK